MLATGKSSSNHDATNSCGVDVLPRLHELAAVPNCRTITGLTMLVNLCDIGQPVDLEQPFELKMSEIVCPNSLTLTMQASTGFRIQLFAFSPRQLCWWCAGCMIMHRAGGRSG